MNSVKSFNLKNKIILVTGGYGFLGTAITKAMAFYGAKTYVLGRDKAKFDHSLSKLTANQSVNIYFQACDISDSKSIELAFEKINEIEGKIDVLVNNAFYSKGQSPDKMTDTDWEFGIDGTLNSVFRCIKGIIPFFKATGGGKIINVSSMYGIVAPQFEVYDESPEFLNPPHYGAAKAGVIQLTKYYAAYLGHLKINVNAVTPGPFPSDTVKENTGFIKALEKKTCLGRVGLPEDLAGAFVFLAAEASDYVTGQNIVVDGGWTAK